MAKPPWSPKKTTRKVRRVRSSEPAPDPAALEAGWVLGSTCLSCRTHYNGWVAQFQKDDCKHGQYDVTLQLPNTSRNYPICDRCLPWHWRTEAARWGMEKEVARVYSGEFV